MLEFLKREETEFVSPADGICIPFEEVNDPTFASGKMGVGFAIRSTGNVAVSPIAGTIVMIPETRHAFGIQGHNGMEILVHIGLNTVRLLGEGFTELVSQGDTVKPGEPVIRFDRELIEKKGRDLTIIVTIASGHIKKMEMECFGKEVKAGEPLTYKV